MGQTLGIPYQLCLRLPSHLLSETFTVLRTSGEMDPGWQIAWLASKHGQKELGKWRILMENKTNPDPLKHVCGWRRIETIEPTRLSGNQEAIHAWRLEVIALLEALELERANKFPPVAASAE
jgi:hypothetical protein